MLGATTNTACPAKKSSDGNERTGRSLPVGVQEMQTAAEIDSKEHRIQRNVKAVPRTILEDQQEHRERAVKCNQHPAHRVILRAQCHQCQRQR